MIEHPCSNTKHEEVDAAYIVAYNNNLKSK